MVLPLEHFDLPVKINAGNMSNILKRIAYKIQGFIVRSIKSLYINNRTEPLLPYKSANDYRVVLETNKINLCKST